MTKHTVIVCFHTQNTQSVSHSVSHSLVQSFSYC